jgi:hypothetical protein
MNRRSRFFRSGLMSSIGAVVVGIAFFAVPSQVARADGSGCDCYVVTPAANPATAGAGTGGLSPYVFKVTNNDPNETLKTLTFTAPADFVITAASGPSGITVSALPGSSVTLNLPNEPTGTTFTVNVTALAPCLAANPGVWGVSGVDSLGETNEVRWSSSPLTVSVTGKCGLAFTGQPAAHTAVNSDILTGIDSTGSPLAVQLVDANNDPLNPANFSASGTPVTVSIQANPVGGTLSGTTTVDSSNGVADFGGLQINTAGPGYDLVASAPGFTTSAPSDMFTIDDQIQPCTSSTCSASASSATTSGTVTTSQATSGDFITTGMGGVSFSCGGTYKPVSDVFGFAVFSAKGVPLSTPLTATLRIDKSLVKSSGHPGAASWQLCYAAAVTSPFTALPGTSGTATIGGVPYNTGLLPNCTSTQGAPCIQARNKNNAGDVIVTFLALGDPYGHG